MKYGDKVSVVTLCYKNYDYLYDTIDSVLSQNYPNIEYIISDDGCDSFPLEDIEKYIKFHNKGNIKKYIIRKNENNIGTVKHENVVCSMIHGEYTIQLSCGDSFYENNSVTKIIKRISKSNEDILLFSRLVCDKEGNGLYYLPHIGDIKRIKNMNNRRQYEALVSGYFWDMASGSAAAYRTEFLKRFGFDERYKLIEDYPLFTKYSWLNKLSCQYDIVSIRYRLGGVSNTTNPIIRKDMELYNSKDRIQHINCLSLFTKEKIRYQLNRDNRKFKVSMFFRYPHVLLWLLSYKVRQKLEISIEKRSLHNSGV